MATKDNKLRLNLGAAEIATLTDEAIAMMTAVGDQVITSGRPVTSRLEHC